MILNDDRLLKKICIGFIKNGQQKTNKTSLKVKNRPT